MAELTILRTTNGAVAAKTVTVTDDGTYKVASFKAGKWFNAKIEEIGDIIGLSEKLELIAKDNTALVIRGQPSPGVNLNQPVTKTLREVPSKSQKAYFQSNPNGVPWIMLDFDGIETPVGIDPFADPRGAMLHLVSLLPEYFHGVSFYWQLSNSAGLLDGGKTIRAHLWFWLDHPVTDLKLRNWAKLVNSTGKLIDAALFNAVQAHYTANPILGAGVVDPFPNGRSGLFMGARHEVSFPVLDFPTLTYAGCSAGLKIAHTFEEWLKRVGDHTGGDGFHEPLLHAAWHYVLEHGSDGTDKEALKHKLKEAVLSADASNHDPSYIILKASDQYLDQLIDSAIAKIGAKWKTGKILGLEPHYPQFEVLSPKAASERLKTHTAEYFNNPRDIGIKAGAGLGKTTEIISQSNILLWRDKKIEIYVPRHGLAEEFLSASKYQPLKKSKLSWQQNVPSWLKCQIIRGRSYDDGDGHYCSKHMLADELSRKGLSVYPNLCRSQDRRCEYYDGCRYITQYQAEYHVRIYPHAYLGLNRGFLDSDLPDYAIIDESFYQTLLSSKAEIPLAEILQANWPEELKDALAEGVQGGKPLLDFLKDSLGDEGIFEAITEAREATEKLFKISLIGLEKDKQAEIIKALPNKNHVSRLLDILEAELKTERSDVHGVTFNAETSTIRLHYRKSITRFTSTKGGVFRNTPVLAIDADLNKEVHNEFFPNTEFFRLDVERNCTVTQVYSTRCSKFKIIADNEAGKRTRRDIQRLINKECQDKKVLVVGPQSITGNPANKEPAIVQLPDSSSLAHFGAIRGVDGWKNFDAVLIISRNELGCKDLEKTARALWFDSIEPLEFADDYTTEARGYRLRNGGEIGVNVVVHPDPRIQVLHELIRESESQQAIDRLRLVHHEGEPKRVILLSNLVLDITVDELVSWQELMAGGSKLSVAWGQLSGVMPLNAVWLSENFPILFASKDIAKWEIKKCVQLGGFPNNNIISFSTQLSLFYFKLESKTGPAGKCVSSLSLEETKTQLELMLGKQVTHLEEIPPPKTESA